MKFDNLFFKTDLTKFFPRRRNSSWNLICKTKGLVLYIKQRMNISFYKHFMRFRIISFLSLLLLFLSNSQYVFLRWLAQLVFYSLVYFCLYFYEQFFHTFCSIRGKKAFQKGKFFFCPVKNNDNLQLLFTSFERVLQNKCHTKKFITHFLHCVSNSEKN